jgi:hypothetical protein
MHRADHTLPEMLAPAVRDDGRRHNRQYEKSNRDIHDHLFHDCILSGKAIAIISVRSVR